MPETDLLTHLEQQLPGIGSQIGGERGVCQVTCGGAHRFSIAEPSVRGD